MKKLLILFTAALLFTGQAWGMTNKIFLVCETRNKIPVLIGDNETSELDLTLKPIYISMSCHQVNGKVFAHLSTEQAYSQTGDIKTSCLKIPGKEINFKSHLYNEEEDPRIPRSLSVQEKTKLKKLLDSYIKTVKQSEKITCTFLTEKTVVEIAIGPDKKNILRYSYLNLPEAQKCFPEQCPKEEGPTTYMQIKHENGSSTYKTFYEDPKMGLCLKKGVPKEVIADMESLKKTFLKCEKNKHLLKTPCK